MTHEKLDALRILSFPSVHTEAEIELAGLLLVQLLADVAVAESLDDSMFKLWEAHFGNCYESAVAARDDLEKETET